MSEISEAAQEYGRVRSEVSSPEDYARAAQGLIDEALRRVFSAIQIRPVAPGPLSSSVPEVPPSTVGVKVETPRPESEPEPVTDLAAYVKALNERDEARAEVARLRQGLWDCFKAAGGDTDGDETPRALVSDIVPLVLECVQDLRNCYRDEQAKQRPEMGPIPDAVCDKAVMVYEQGDEGSMRSDMRAALEAVRPDLCRYEVVKTQRQLWVHSDGDLWGCPPSVEAVAEYGPFTPVIVVRDPSREVVK